MHYLRNIYNTHNMTYSINMMNYEYCDKNYPKGICLNYIKIKNPKVWIERKYQNTLC